MKIKPLFKTTLAADMPAGSSPGQHFSSQRFRVFYKHGSKQIVCFGKSELQALLKEKKRVEIDQILESKGLSLIDMFYADDDLKHEIAAQLSESITKDKDEVEIFAATYIFDYFYGEDPEVCFYLKSAFNPRRNVIDSLDVLKDSIEESSMTDFIFKTSDGFRLIQLKRYRGALTNAALFAFIKAKLDHYGRQLGCVNLLIILQSQEADVSALDFHTLHAEILALGLSFPGEILISYNENNQFNVVNRVYPELTSMRKPIQHTH